MTKTFNCYLCDSEMGRVSLTNVKCTNCGVRNTVFQHPHDPIVVFRKTFASTRDAMSYMEGLSKVVDQTFADDGSRYEINCFNRRQLFKTGAVVKITHYAAKEIQCHT